MYGMRRCSAGRSSNSLTRDVVVCVARGICFSFTSRRLRVSRSFTAKIHNLPTIQRTTTIHCSSAYRPLAQNAETQLANFSDDEKIRLNTDFPNDRISLHQKAQIRKLFFSAKI